MKRPVRMTVGQRPSTTLLRYIARQYFVNFLLLFFILLGFIYIFDVIELIRRASSRQGIPITTLLGMGMLVAPEHGLRMTPFAILFSAMFTFWRLTRSHELVVARAVGMSAWQFIMPMVTVALFVGLVQIAIVNPVTSVLMTHYRAMEATLLKGAQGTLDVAKTGLWLRQSDEEGNAQILHAARATSGTMILHTLTIYHFDPQDRFVRRQDAATAYLRQGYWDVKDVTESVPGQAPVTKPEMQLPTTLTPQGIEDGFADPSTISFWELTEAIATREVSGFGALRLRLYRQSLLALPMLMAAMVVIAAVFSLRPPRRGGTLILVAGGLGSGFGLFLMNDVVKTLGLSEALPVAMAAWIPTGLSWLAGVTALLYMEDG